MKKRLMMALAAGALVAAMVPAAASADNHTCDSGREYAQAHIVPLAHAGVIGQVHKPGTHRGFAGVPPVCPDPT